MKPPLDHLILRPHPYVRAAETSQPGYLERKFQEVREKLKKPKRSKK